MRKRSDLLLSLPFSSVPGEVSKGPAHPLPWKQATCSRQHSACPQTPKRLVAHIKWKWLLIGTELNLEEKYLNVAVYLVVVVGGGGRAQLSNKILVFQSVYFIAHLKEGKFNLAPRWNLHPEPKNPRSSTSWMAHLDVNFVVWLQGHIPQACAPMTPLTV